MSLYLSSRCTGISPSATLEINTRAKQLRAEGKHVYGFAVGEPDFPTPEYICDAAREALKLGLTRYTPVAGTKELRGAICEKLERDNNLHYKPTEVIVSNGAKQALLNAFVAILNPGDEVLLPTPCWVSYPEMIRMAGGVPIMVKTKEEEGFLPSLKLLEKLTTPRTKAIVINSPNNPTGCVYPPELLEKIAEFAIEKEIYVVSDEIYERLIYDGQQHVSIASFGPQIHKQAIVINGLSKTFAMTGWRMGYAAASEDIVNAMAAYQSHATSGANSIAQYASYKALQNGAAFIRAMREEYDARRQLMVAKINGMDGVSCITPHGAFYVMLNVKKLIGRTFRGEKIEDAVALSRMLLDAVNVAVVPGDAFEAPGFCRISYAVSREDIDAGLDAIGRFVGMVE